MEPLILQTASEDAGKRLDAWLAEQTELTRSAVQKLMEEGRVTAAGKPLAKNIRLTGGETVFFTGHGRLMQRPLKPYFELFDRMGIRYELSENLLKSL